MSAVRRCILPLVGVALVTASTRSHANEHVSVVELPTGADYRRTTAGVERRAAIAREFFAHHSDAYDFLIVFPAFDADLRDPAVSGPGVDTRGIHLAVRNAVRGIGLPVFDNGAQFGSAQRLKAYVDVKGLEESAPELTNSVAIVAHELAHQFGANVRFMDRSTARPSGGLVTGGGHWSYFLDSEGDVLLGNDWSAHDGGFVAGPERQRYSALLRYLMGLAPASEVSPLTLLVPAAGEAATAESLPEVGRRLVATPKSITIDDIIAAEGARAPSYAESQRVFRAAFLVLKPSGGSVTAQQLAYVDAVRRAMGPTFFQLTAGRGVLETSLVEVPATTAFQGIQRGVDFLVAAQRDGGSWADSPRTGIRDTEAALRALAPFQQQPAVAQALSRADTFLTSAATANADDAARRVRALRSLDALRAVDPSLAEFRAGTTGVPLLRGYGTSPLDTALALGARLLTGAVATSDSDWVHLRSVVSASGGWAATPGGPVRIEPTVEALGVLHGLAARTAVDETIAGRALASLRAAGQPNGAFRDDLDSPARTAQAVTALAQWGRLLSTEGDAARSFLTGRQDFAGSWNSSVFETAHALHALSMVLVPNLTIGPSDLVVPRSAVAQGERVVFRLGVRNSGSAISDPTTIRVTTEAGGLLAAAVPVPALASGQRVVIDVPIDTAGAGPAAQALVFVDPDARSGEAQRADNQLAVPFAVQAALAAPELFIGTADVSLSPAVLTAIPEQITAQIAVSNAGLASATGVTVVVRAGGQDVASSVIDVPAQSTRVVTLSWSATAVAGALDVAVVVDPLGVVSEPFEDNNRWEGRVPVQPTVRAALTAISGSAPSVLQGRDLGLLFTVENRGTSPIVGGVVQVEVRDSSGAVVGTAPPATVSVPAGASGSASTTWRARTPGAFELVARLLVAGDLTSADDSRQVSVAVVAASEANLRVVPSDVTVAPTPLLQLQPSTVSAVVRNDGAVSAGAFEVRLRNLTTGEELLRQVVAGLNVGQSASVGGVLTPQTSASQRIAWEVDVGLAVPEFDEDDNVVVVPFEPVPAADLQITPASLTLSPAFPRVGEGAALSVLIANRGGQASQATQAQVFVDSLASPAATLAVPPLQPGASVTVPWSWPGATASVSVRFIVRVNADRSAAEADYANNAAERAVVVQDSALVVTEPFISPNGDAVRETTQIQFRLAGEGLATVTLATDAGVEVRALHVSGTAATWDGRDEAGSVVADGTYVVRVRRGTQALSGAMVTVDTNSTSLLDSVGTPFLNDESLGNGVELATQDPWSWDFGPGFRRLVTDSVTPNEFLFLGMKGPDTCGLFARTIPGGVARLVTPTSWPCTLRYELLGTPYGSAGYVKPKTQTVDAPEVIATLPDGGLIFVRAQRFPSEVSCQQAGCDTGGLFRSIATRSRSVRVIALADGAERVVSGLSLGVDYSDYECGPELPYSGEAFPRCAGVQNSGGYWFNGPSRRALRVAPSPSGRSATLSRDFVVGDRVLQYELETGAQRVFPESSATAFLSDDRVLVLEKLRGLVEYGAAGEVVWVGADAGITMLASASAAPQQVLYAVREQQLGNGRLVEVAPVGPAGLGSPVAHGEVVEVSPSGRYVAVAEPLVIVDAATGRRSPALGPATALSPRIEDLIWSRDERSLVYWPTRPGLSPRVLSTLANSAAVLTVARGPGRGGLEFRGTAQDRNFATWTISARPRGSGATPTIVLSGTNAVVSGRFGAWEPPAAGQYDAFLTVTDMAGNSRTVEATGVWAQVQPLSTLRATPPLASPNGDGRLDAVEVSYALSAPHSFTVEVRTTAGALVRTFPRTHLAPGAFALSWDGLNESGEPVPDGQYLVTAESLTARVAIDRTSPSITLSAAGSTTALLPATDSSGVERRYPALVVPAVYSASDPNLTQWRLERTTDGSSVPAVAVRQGTTPVDTASLSDGFDPLPADAVRGGTLRLVAEDGAENASVTQSVRIDERLAVVGVGPADVLEPSRGTLVIDGRSAPRLDLLATRGVSQSFSPQRWAFLLGTTVGPRLGAYAVAYRPRGSTGPYQVDFAHVEQRGELLIVWDATGLPEQALDLEIRATDEQGRSWVAPFAFDLNRRAATLAACVPFQAGGPDELEVGFAVSRRDLGERLWLPAGAAVDVFAEGSSVASATWLVPPTGSPDDEAPLTLLNNGQFSQSSIDRALLVPFGVPHASVAGLTGCRFTLQLRGTLSSGEALVGSTQVDVCGTWASDVRVEGGLLKASLRSTHSSPVSSVEAWVRASDAWRLVAAVPGFVGDRQVALVMPDLGATCGAAAVRWVTNLSDGTQVDSLTTDARRCVRGAASVQVPCSTLRVADSVRYGRSTECGAPADGPFFSVSAHAEPGQTINQLDTWLLDAAGNRAAQVPVDAFVAGQAHVVAEVRVPPMSLPPGDYRVEGELVDSAGRVLRAISAATVLLGPASLAVQAPTVGAELCSTATPAGGGIAFLGEVSAQDLRRGDVRELVAFVGRAGGPATEQVLRQGRFLSTASVPLHLAAGLEGPLTVTFGARDQTGALGCSAPQQTEWRPTLALSGVQAPAVLSPDGDGVAETGLLVFELDRPAAVTVRAVAAGGQPQDVASLSAAAGTVQVPLALAGLPDGPVELSIDAVATCGRSARASSVTVIDTGLPVAQIDLPTAGEGVTGDVTVVGLAQDETFESFELSVGSSASPTAWAHVTAGTTPQDGVLGVWTTQGLSAGVYTLRLVVRDRAGHASEALRTVTLAGATVLTRAVLDRDAVSPNGDGRSDTVVVEVTLAQAAAIDVTLSPTVGSPVSVVSAALAAGVHQLTVPAAAWGGMPDGRYGVRVTAVAGPTTESSALVLRVDRGAPVAEIVSPLNGAVVSASIAPRLRTQGVATWSLSLSEAGAASRTVAGGVGDIDGVVGLAVALGEGPVTLELTAEDEAGNRASQSTTFEVDLTAPVVSIAAPAADTVVDKQAVPILVSLSEVHLTTVELVARRGSVVTPIASAASLPDGGAFTWVAAGEPDGPVTIVVSAVDAVGARSEFSRPVVLGTAPSVTLTSPQGSVDRANLSFGGTASVPFGSGTWALEAAEGPPAPQPGDEGYLSLATGALPLTGGIDVPPPPLPPGTYRIRLRAMTTAGLTSTDERVVEVRDSAGAPTGVLAQPSATDPNAVVLSWNFASGDVLGYQVLRSGGGATALLSAAADTSSLLDVGLTPGTYAYTVAAVLGDGRLGPPSDPAAVEVLGPAPAPAARPTLVRTGARSVRVSWASAGSPTDTYSVERRAGLGASARVASALTAGLFDDTALLDGVYEYRIVRVEAGGREAGPSEPASVTIDTRPPSVQLHTPGNGARVGDRVAVVGTAASEADFVSYELFATGLPGTAGEVSLTSGTVARRSERLATLDVSGWPDGAAGLLRLRAESRFGGIAEVTSSFIVDAVRPAAPVLTSVTASGSDVVATWIASGSPDVRGYLVLRNDVIVHGPPGMTLADSSSLALPATTTSYAESVGDGVHRYQVVAVDQAGNFSDLSNAMSATVEARAPSVAFVAPAPEAVINEEVEVVVDGADDDLAQVRIEVRPSSSPTFMVLFDAPNPPWAARLRPATFGTDAVELRAQARDVTGQWGPMTELRRVFTEPALLPFSLGATIDGTLVTLRWSPASSDVRGTVVSTPFGVVNSRADITPGVTVDVSSNETAAMAPLTGGAWQAGTETSPSWQARFAGAVVVEGLTFHAVGDPQVELLQAGQWRPRVAVPLPAVAEGVRFRGATTLSQLSVAARDPLLGQTSLVTQGVRFTEEWRVLQLSAFGSRVEQRVATDLSPLVLQVRTTGASLGIEGSRATPNAEVTLSLTQGGATTNVVTVADSSGGFTATVPLQIGFYMLTSTSLDAAGNRKFGAPLAGAYAPPVDAVVGLMLDGVQGRTVTLTATVSGDLGSVASVDLVREGPFGLRREFPLPPAGGQWIDTVDDLEAGNYRYFAQAVGPTGLRGAPSDPVLVSLGASFPAPADVVATFVPPLFSGDPLSVEVRWTAVPSATSYSVEVAPARAGPFASLGVVLMPFAAEFLPASNRDGERFYRVQAVGPAGERSPWSAVARAVLPAGRPLTEPWLDALDAVNGVVPASPTRLLVADHGGRDVAVDRNSVPFVTVATPPASPTAVASSLRADRRVPQAPSSLLGSLAWDPAHVVAAGLVGDGTRRTLTYLSGGAWATESLPWPDCEVAEGSLAVAADGRLAGAVRNLADETWWLFLFDTTTSSFQRVALDPSTNSTGPVSWTSDRAAVAVAWSDGSSHFVSVVGADSLALELTSAALAGAARELAVGASYATELVAIVDDGAGLSSLEVHDVFSGWRSLTTAPQLNHLWVANSEVLTVATDGQRELLFAGAGTVRRVPLSAEASFVVDPTGSDRIWIVEAGQARAVNGTTLADQSWAFAPGAAPSAFAGAAWRPLNGDRDGIALLDGDGFPTQGVLVDAFVALVPLVPGSNTLHARQLASGGVVGPPSEPLLVRYDSTAPVTDLQVVGLELAGAPILSASQHTLRVRAVSADQGTAAAVRVTVLPATGAMRQQIVQASISPSPTTVDVPVDLRGLEGAVTIVAVLDPTFQVTGDPNRENNVSELSVLVGPSSGVGLTVHGVVVGDALSALLTVYNPSVALSGATTSTALVDGAGAVVAAPPDTVWPVLPARGIATQTTSLAIAAVPSGSYTLESVLWRSGQVLFTAREPVVIARAVSPEVIAAAAHAQFGPTEAVVVDARVRNPSNVDTVRGAASVRLSPGAAPATPSLAALLVAPGSAATVSFAWQAGQLPAGTYAGVVSFDAGTTGATSAPFTFVVAGAPLMAGTVEVTGATTSPPLVAEATVFGVRGLVSNTGSAAGQIAARVELRAIDGAVLSASPPGVFTVSAGGVQAVDATLVAPGQAGTYVLALVASVDGEPDHVLAVSALVVRDARAPAVEFMAPFDDGAVSAQLSVRVRATDPSGVGQVQLLLDGAPALSLALVVGSSVDGEWAGTLGGVAPGYHLVGASAVDGAGNAGQGVPVRVFVDAVAPTLVVHGVTEGGRYTVPVSPQILASDDGAPPVVTTTVNGAPFASGSVLGEGEYLLEAVAVDTVGNTTVQRVRFSVDTTAPLITLAGPLPGQAVVGPIALGFAAADVHLDEVSATVDGAAHANGQPVTALGAHTWVVTARDTFGNVSSLSRSFSVVSDALAVVVHGVVDGQVTRGPVTPEAVATGAAAVRAWLNGAPYVLGTPVSGHGTYVLRVEVEGPTGAVSDVVVTFAIDAAPPAVTVAAPALGAVLGTAQALSFSVTDEHLASTSSFVDGAPWSGTAIVDTEGAHTWRVEAVDLAGNATVREGGFVLDFTPPAITFAGVAEGALVGHGVTLDAALTEANPGGVFATLDGAPFVLGSVVASTGAHVLVVVATDAAGNRAEQELRFEIDAEPPVLTLSGVADGDVGAEPVTLVFSAQDPHLAFVRATVDGAPISSGDAVSTSGAHTWTVTAEDSLGNRVVETRHFTLELEAPRIAVGGVTDGLVTNVAVTPVVIVQGAALVDVTLDGLPFVSGTTVAAEGAHLLRVQAANAAAVAVVTVSFAIDLTPPVLVLAGVADGAQVQGPVALSFSTVDAHGVVAAATLNGAPHANGAVVAGEGSYEWIVTATDIAGNAATETRRFVLDRTAPSVTVAGVVDGLVSAAAQVSPTVSTGDAVSVSVTLDDAPYAPGTPVTVEGAHVLRVEAADRAGNTTVVLVRFTLDRTAPAVQVAGVADGAVLRGPVALSWTVGDATPVQVSATLDGFSFAGGPVVAEGPHTLAVTATDGAGNSTTVSRAFTIDDTAPVISLAGVADGAVTRGPLTLTFEVADATPVTVDASVNGVPVASGAVVTTDGTYVWVVRAMDAAGNVTQRTRTFSVDTTPPVISVGGVVDGQTLTGPTVITFGAQDAHPASTSASLDGAPFVSGQVVTAVGAHVLFVEAVDAAGNSATRTVTFSLQPVSGGACRSVRLVASLNHVTGQRSDAPAAFTPALWLAVPGALGVTYGGAGSASEARLTLVTPAGTAVCAYAGAGDRFMLQGCSAGLGAGALAEVSSLRVEVVSGDPAWSRTVVSWTVEEQAPCRGVAAPPSAEFAVCSHATVALAGSTQVAGSVGAHQDVQLQGSARIDDVAVAGRDVRTQGSARITDGCFFGGTATATGSSSTGPRHLVSPPPTPCECGVDVPARLIEAQAANTNGALAAEPSWASSLVGGSLNVGGSAHLLLPSGRYAFDSVSLSGSAEVTLGGPVELHVARGVSIGGSAKLNWAGSQPLVIYAGGAARAGDAFALSGSARVNAVVWSPALPAQFSGSAELGGALAAGAVTLQGSSRVTFGPGPRPAVPSLTCGGTP